MDRFSASDNALSPAVDVALVRDGALARYRFPDWHPLKPERFTLAIELAQAWGLVCASEATLPDGVAPRPCATPMAPLQLPVTDLELIHDVAMIDAVMRASEHPQGEYGRWGIGPGDTPAVAGMHDAALAVCGATAAAFDAVLRGSARRTFSPSGGMHHAHRDRAAGFCIYNDCAVAIARGLQHFPGLRVAYVDVDVHHGDGVQEAFAENPDVLTISVHESGAFRYPGTGASHDFGSGAGRGATLNVPLHPGSGPAQYERALVEVVVPALVAFAPDVVLIQGGGDSHVDDPLASIDNTIRGYLHVIRTLVDAADVCARGRVVMVGGGGYQPFDVVPRMWAGALAVLLGVEPPDSVPEEWVLRCAHAAEARGERLDTPTTRLYLDEPVQVSVSSETVLANERVLAGLKAAHPLLEVSAGDS